MTNFGNVVGKLMSSNNEERRQAEMVYNNQKSSQPMMVLRELAKLQIGHSDVKVRTMASVLSRRIVQPTSKINIDQNTMQFVQQAMLKAFTQEPVSSARRKICNAIAPLAARAPFPQLLPVVFGKLGHSDANHRESALFLLSKVCEYAVDIVVPHVAKLHAAVKAGLSNGQPMNVRIASLDACCSWMLSTKDANQSDKSKFMPFIPAMLAVVSDALNKGNEVEAQESLTKLIDLLRVDPDTCRSSMMQVAGGMMQVAAAKSLEPATRKLALETLVQMCESTPALVRKCTPFVSKIFPLSLSMVFECDADDFEPDDYTPPDQDTDAPYLVGESALLRITMALGKTFVPQLLSNVQSLANSTSWAQRRACCVAIGSVVNGGGKSVRKVLKPHLAALLQMLIGKIRNDPHQWVRFEAIHCVAAICTAYESHVQEQFHALVAPGLAYAMEAGRNCMRVRGHAASAIQIFARPGKCEEDNLKPHTHLLLNALCNLLKTGTKSAQEEALTAVACIAKVIETDFGPYYNAFMPGIKSILGQAVTKENRPLQAKAIECLGLIAESVGPQRFGADAQAAMNLIMSLQSSGLPADDPRAPELMQCAVRICKCVGDQFVTCLPRVLPPLLQCLDKSKIGMSVTDVEEEDSNAKADKEAAAAGMSTWVIGIRGVGDKKISLNTAAIDDMHMAISILREYATVLRAKFLPFVEPCAKAIIPLVDFEFFEGVRSIAALTLSELLRCATEGLRHGNKPQTFALQLLRTSMLTLIRRLEQEMKKGVESDTLACFAESIKLCLEVCYRSGSDDIEHEPTCRPVLSMPKEMLVPMGKLLCECANQSVQRRLSTMKAAREKMGELFDDVAKEALEEDLEIEEELMTQLVDAVGYVMKTHKADSSAMIDSTFGPLLMNLLRQNGLPETLLWSSLCFFDDVVEHCGIVTSQKYLPICAPMMIRSVGSNDPYVRQAAIYGVGQLAEHAKEFFAKSNLCGQALNLLMQVLRRPDAREEEQLAGTENAVGAIGRICAFHGARNDVPTEEILPVWLSFLPLRDDMIEAYIVHRHLNALLNAKNVALLGKSNERLPMVLKVVCEIVAEELADKSTVAALTNVLGALKTSMNTQILTQIAGSVSAKNRAKTALLLGLK